MATTVLITGASQGIGKATALLLAQKGYDVIGAARRSDRLEALAQDLRAQGQTALMIPTDVTDFEQVNALVEKALDAYGKIDVLVNNAGICMTAPIAETTLQDWRKIIDVVRRPQAEVVVGSGAIATTTHRLAPSLTQWLMQRSISQ